MLQLLVVLLLLASPLMTLAQQSCQLTADFGILMDGSGSIVANDFRQQKDFVIRFMEHTDQYFVSPRFAMYQFAGTSATQIFPLTFNASSLKNLVANINQQGGNTPTGTALGVALSMFQANTRPVPEIVLLITDGAPTPDSEIALARQQAKALKESGSRIISVGVGDAFNNAQYRQLLNDIASQPTERFSYFIGNFTALTKTLTTIADITCFGINSINATCGLVQKTNQTGSILIRGQNLFTSAFLSCRWTFPGGRAVTTMGTSLSSQGDLMSCPLPPAAEPVTVNLEVTVDGRAFTNSKFQYNFVIRLNDCIVPAGGRSGVFWFLVIGLPLILLLLLLGLLWFFCKRRQSTDSKSEPLIGAVEVPAAAGPVGADVVAADPDFRTGTRYIGFGGGGAAPMRVQWGKGKDVPSAPRDQDQEWLRYEDGIARDAKTNKPVGYDDVVVMAGDEDEERSNCCGCWQRLFKK